MPEKEKLEAETHLMRVEIEKTRKEVALLAQQAAKENPRFLVEYIYAGSTVLGSSSEEECNIVDPATGKVISKVPLYEIKDFPTEVPSPDDWSTILRRDFPEVLKYVRANPSLDGVTQQTQYLVLQRRGSFHADELRLQVVRVNLRLAVENSLLFAPTFDANRYGSVREEILDLGSLETNQALRIPVSNIIDFDENDLFTKEELDERPVLPDYALSYGVVYLPREITYKDPSSGELIREDVRPPLSAKRSLDRRVDCELLAGG